MPTDNDTVNIDNIIARVKKLQALGDASKNHNLNEVKAATKIAEQLISQYRLSAAQLESEGHASSEPFKDEACMIIGRRLAYIESLLTGLCKHFSGSYFVQSGRNSDNKGECLYFLTAKESDWTVIHYFINYLFSEIDRISRAECKGMGLSESNSFRMGMANGICSLFAELRETTKSDVNNCTALVFLDKRGEEAKREMYKKHDLKKASGISGGTNYDARSRGYERGRQVSINSALNK